MNAENDKLCFVADDVIMKQHLGVKWLDLSPVQLVNWPHIEITFRTQDIYFVRRQATEFVRYLNFLPHETNKHSDSIIEHAEAYGHQECYSYDFLEKYVRVYLEALKTAPVVSNYKSLIVSNYVCFPRLLLPIYMRCKLFWFSSLKT